MKMFWGLLLKANKRYSQVVGKSFHISHATLDLGSCSADDENVVQVWVNSDEINHLICNLDRKTSHATLDLAFSEGETIAFFSKGPGQVHLTGYLIPEEPDYEGLGGYGEEEDESIIDEDEEAPQLVDGSKKKGKQAVELNGDDDSDEDDSDFDENALEAQLQGSDDDDDEDDEELEEEEDSDDEDEAPPAKVAKVDKQAGKQKQNGLANGKAPKEQPQKKADQKNQTASPQKNDASQKPKTKTLANGVVIEDLRVGKGPEAKTGRKVQVFYEGRLKTNNKVFDSTKSGDGFKFILGRGEVIKGWDLGVQGMKVGSKRRIVCPPNAAYGARGSPPVIPPNSTLVFDVELRGVN